jgi:hypothetical protein
MTGASGYIQTEEEFFLLSASEKRIRRSLFRVEIRVTMKQENSSLGVSDIWVEISTRYFPNVDITTNSQGFVVGLVTS